MAKKILFHDDARTALKRGMDSVADAVKVTIGPRGRNVILNKGYGGPTITNDGVSIAKEISLSDPFEQMGVQIIREVAEKTNEAAGDGTTTSVLLAQAIASEGIRHIGRGQSVIGIKRGIEEATAEIIAELQHQSKKIKTTAEIAQVATISAESNELGVIIAETIQKVGRDGVVTVEESQSFGVTSDVVEGMSFDRGYLSPYMVTDPERMESVHKNPPILITDKKISSIKDILPLLEKLAQTGQRDLVIIADDVDGEALATLVLNKLRGTLNVLCLKAPGFGDRKKDLLADIAVVIGATVISEETGNTFDKADLGMLGTASKVVAKKDSTIIIGGAGKPKAIAERILLIKALRAQASSKFDQEKLEERIAKLSGGVAVIRVGAATETEMKYLKLKIEDAVNATKAAIEEGVVAGGGTALVVAADKVRTARSKKSFPSREIEIGYEIVLVACEAALRQIGANAGRGDGSIVVEDVRRMKSGGGYDAQNDTLVPDMIGAGIIDPVKVTRHALANAASAAATFLTTEVAVAEEPKKESMGGHASDMGMM